MSVAFDPKQGPVVVQVKLCGPAGDTYAELALDTGATSTVVNTGVLVSVGYDVAAAADRLWITTGSGIEFVPRLSLCRIEALGQARECFPVVSHTLPTTAAVDGVLGLDFLRDQRLVVDFREGLITLE